MRALPVLWIPLLACCALPPRVDDRSTPENAYATFRGAIARGEHEREWDCMSERLQGRLGLSSRSDWKDARTVALTQSHLLVKGICRSDVESATKLPDGRVRLELSFPFGYKGRVTMWRAVVLRGFVEGAVEPELYDVLGRIRLVKHDEGLLLVVPKDKLEWIDKEKLDQHFRRFEAAEVWFLDDFAAGDETPESVAGELKEKEKG